MKCFDFILQYVLIDNTCYVKELSHMWESNLLKTCITFFIYLSSIYSFSVSLPQHHWLFLITFFQQSGHSIPNTPFLYQAFIFFYCVLLYSQHY